MNDLSYVGMTQCFLCGEDKDIVIDRRLRESLPRHVGVTDLEPCGKCKDFMKMGVIVVAYDEEKTDFLDTIKLPNPENKHVPIDTKMPNFHRTGGWWVVRDDAIERMIPALGVDAEPILTQALKQRVLFLPDKVCEFLGFHEENKRLEAEKQMGQGI